MRRRGAIDLGNIALATIILLVIVVVGFMVIGKIEENMNLSSDWASTYSDFKASVKGVFPLLAVALIVMVSIGIIAIIYQVFRPGVGA